jgi:membrane fusion protein (multidrug efflux system)
MNRKLAIGAGVIIVLALTLASCGKKEQGKNESIADIQKREGVPVTIVKAEKGALAAFDRMGGTVEGYDQAVLSAGLPATVLSVDAAVGQRVEKDAVLARLTPTMASPYAMAKANYETVEKSVNRVKSLAQEGGVAQDVVDQVETGYTVAKENLEGARKAENVIAPFAGTVVEIYETANSVVGPGAKIVKIASLDRVRVKLAVTEAVITNFRAGQKAYLITSADTIAGVVERVPLAADEGNHTFAVEAVFANRGNALRPGMYVTVDVVTREKKNVCVLPMEAVQSDADQKYVYVVGADQLVHKTPVVVGIRGGSNYEIISGVSAGDQVVQQGASNVNDGTKVKVVEQ